MKRFALMCAGLLTLGVLASSSWSFGQHAAPVAPAAPAELTLPTGVPAKVAPVLAYIDENGEAPRGFVGGRVFTNDGRGGEEVLPRIDAEGDTITYHEYDVNKHVRGRNRGVERLVLGTNGSAYFTPNHYRSYIAIRGERIADLTADSQRVETAARDALPPIMLLPADVSTKVHAVLEYVISHRRAMPNYVGGRVFENRGGNGAQRLPRVDADGDAIGYHEWDVNPRRPGQNRGKQRLVTGSDGSSYYTGDHYLTFIRFE